MNEKLIIDTDLGADDALALFCALRDPSSEVLSITTVFGSTESNIATRNVLHLLELFDYQTPVYEGVAKPLMYPFFPSLSPVQNWHNAGHTPLTQEQSQHAVLHIIEMAEKYPGEITLLALGPLTNIALALSIDPGIALKIKRVVVMGGNINTPGHTSSASEINFYHDPHAADIVLQAPWPVTIIGLDVIHKIILVPKLFEHLEQHHHKQGQFLTEIFRPAVNHSKTQYGIDGCYAYETTAVACTLHPNWFTFDRGPMRIICDELFRGKLLFYSDDAISSQRHRWQSNPWADRPGHYIATHVDDKSLLNWVENL